MSHLATLPHGCKLLTDVGAAAKMVDRTLLKQALSELVVLKNRVHDPSRFVGQLYVSALQEWAERLSVDPSKLNKIVLIREAISSHSLH